MKNKRLIIIMSSVVALLLIPLVAMQFTNEVNWGIMDFVIMSLLLFGTGGMIELVLRKVESTKGRLIISGAIVFSFLLIWAELAVGIMGTPFAGS